MPEWCIGRAFGRRNVRDNCLQNLRHAGSGFCTDQQRFRGVQRQGMLNLLPGSLGNWGPGLRAVAIAEEFRFDVGFGDGGAVEFDEDAFAAIPFCVDGAGDEFLAGAGLAIDEDAAIGGSHEANLLAQGFERERFRR